MVEGNLCSVAGGAEVASGRIDTAHKHTHSQAWEDDDVSLGQFVCCMRVSCRSWCFAMIA